MTNRTQALLDALHTLELQDAELSALKKHHQKEVQLILAERDRTFSLMLHRAQSAEAKLAIAVEALEVVAMVLTEGNDDGVDSSFDDVEFPAELAARAEGIAIASLAKIKGETK